MKPRSSIRKHERKVEQRSGLPLYFVLKDLMKLAASFSSTVSWSARALLPMP